MSANFTAVAERFLAKVWEDYPCTATAMGIHTYDDQLDDFSPDRWEMRRRNMRDAAREVAAVDPSSLEPSQRIDHELLSRHVAISQAVWEQRPPWEMDPVLFAGIASGGLFPLLVREFAPLPERARSMTARLHQVPGALSHARQTLTRPARIHTEIAMEMTDGSLQFLESVIPGVASQVGDVGVPLRGATETASQALREYRGFLEQELLPRSTADFALGRALFDRVLAEEHLLDLNADDLDRIGREAIEETKGEIHALATAIDPDVPWAEVVRRAKAEHVATAEEVKPAYVEAMERARQFVRQHALATLPPGESLEIIDTPEHYRALMPYAAYMPPPPFEADAKGFFFVTPVGLQSPIEQQRAQLQGHNRYHLEIVALHEAYPGHHLQFVCAREHPSRLRRFFVSTVFCEGWALYCEQLMRELGFLAGPMGHLMQLRDQLWRACRVVIDASLHAGGMTIEEATRLMVETACLEEPNARAEVRRYTTSPTQPMSYLIGKRELLGIRDEYQRRAGSGFTLQGFHDALLSHGTIPPALVRQEMFAAG